MTDVHHNSAEPRQTGAAGARIDLVIVALAEIRRAYPVRDLLGRSVTNDIGEHIGTLDDLLLEDATVWYAILSVGGFLGMGAHKVVVVFDALTIDDDMIALPGASKDALRQMPIYDAEQARRDRLPRRTARRGVKDAGQIVETAGGEPLPGVVADVTDGDR
ncbi:MAG TPA: PRC-barrel domain-containing protein [Caulobacteraceae bacterium]|nr:PRC-barrel domain-containing protein [Caulobacteraceae bacterium]